jgi:hypothetical protein
MSQVLSSTISARAIVRSTGLGAGAGSARTGSRFERTAYTTLRTAYPRNLAALGNGCYDVSALFLTLGTKLVDAIANCVSRLLGLWFFGWHEEQTRVPIANYRHNAPLFVTVYVI